MIKNYNYFRLAILNLLEYHKGIFYFMVDILAVLVFVHILLIKIGLNKRYSSLLRWDHPRFGINMATPF